MRIKDWLADSQRQLEKAGITTARLDCLVLLEDVTGRDRAWLLANPEAKLTAAQQKKLNTKVAQRSKHQPLAYIRGKTEFFGRQFIINKDVLEPRPESETMIEQLKKLPQPAHIIDIGTGSGALAITAKLEIPQATVTGVDIDPACLKVARQNATQHKGEVSFHKSDLLSAVDVGPNTTLLCNLPYVSDSYTLNDAAMNEPRLAIFGGKDGLDHYRNLFQQINGLKTKPTYVLTESLPFQHADLATIAKDNGYNQLEEDDFVQVLALK